jgi:hypothetical protein
VIIALLFSLLAQWLMSLIRPGVVVSQRATPPPRSAPIDTGTWFVTGLADQGPLVPTLITSLAEFEANFGPRVSYSLLYDSIDTYFREGGGSVYVSRVVGPAAVIATKNLLDAGAATSLVITAIGPGAYGNSIKIAVSAGIGAGTFVLTVSDINNVVLETSPDLIDTQAAVDWASNSNYIRATLGASVNDPAVAAASALAGGTDDRAAITDTQWQAALDRMSKDLGPGQVSAPGRTTDTGHTQLYAHAANNRRVAIIDLPDSATAATLKTSVNAARLGNQRWGACFAPWDIVPGVIAGTTRKVPPSARVAGNISRNDRANNPNTPAAGDLGQALFATGLSQPSWDDPARQDLNNNGVNLSVVKFGGVRTYGWRSGVDANADPDWRDFGNARLFMAIASQGDAIGETFLFDEIDGQGHTLSAFGGALTAMMMDYWVADALYGVTPQEAFFVDVGPTVNTPETIANDELHAVIATRMSPMGELVVIEIVKTRITQGVV